jgi:hypothetical protein
MKARTVEPEKTTVTRQRLGRHFCGDMYATTEELLEEMFSMQSKPRLYNEDQWDKFVMVVSSGSTILAFSCHVTIHIYKQCNYRTFNNLAGYVLGLSTGG